LWEKKQNFVHNKNCGKNFFVIHIFRSNKKFGSKIDMSSKGGILVINPKLMKNSNFGEKKFGPIFWSKI